MKLKILTSALALLLTGSVLTGFSTQAAPSKAESDDHLAQEISEAVFRMDGATAQVSYDGGSTWDTSPTVELPDFYSYEEFAGWIETESDNLQALVAAGELTQEEAAAAIAQYQSALSGIEDGVQVGKRSSYEEDQIFFSMPNNPQSEVFQTVLYDGNSYRNFGPYNTKAELYAALEQYTNDQTKSGNMTEVEANSILLYHEAIDYLREMQRRRDRELSFSDLPQMEMDKLCVVDHYPSDRFTFSSHGYDLHIENELVADAFAGLSVQEQSILILHFVLDLPDQEVGRLVGMSRSAVQRRRAKSLTELRIKLAALMPKGG